MKYEQFAKIIELLEQHQKSVSDAYKLDIDLINFCDPVNSVVSMLFEAVYGKEGNTWIEWYLYDRNGNDNLKAWDADKNPICYSVESLWEYLEKNYT